MFLSPSQFDSIPWAMQPCPCRWFSSSDGFLVFWECRNRNRSRNIWVHVFPWNQNHGLGSESEPVPESSLPNGSGSGIVWFRSEPDPFAPLMVAILWCFEAVFVLKVNLFKSAFLGILVEENVLRTLADSWGARWVLYRHCTLVCLCSGRVSKTLWNSVVEKVEYNLAFWKAKYLSLWGRITLIQLALAKLPIYLMSFQMSDVGSKPHWNSYAREGITRKFWFGRLEFCLH